jgi:hypothetical protein
MSAGDAPSGTAGIQSQSRRQSSLWAIELSALLVAAGIARGPVEPRSGEGALVERGNRRGGLAEGPFEIPALGWKDILLRVYNGISQDRILTNAGRNLLRPAGAVLGHCSSGFDLRAPIQSSARP